MPSTSEYGLKTDTTTTGCPPSALATGVGRPAAIAARTAALCADAFATAAGGVAFGFVAVVECFFGAAVARFFEPIPKG